MVPNMPRTAANNMPANRKIRRVIPALYIGMENEEIAVTATTITKKDLQYQPVPRHLQ